MATVLVCWELGEGWGHILPLKSLSLQLAARGHRITAAFRDVDRGCSAFAGTGIPVHQAMVQLKLVERPIRPVVTFAHLLHNVGFADAVELRDRVQYWQRLYESVRPDLVIFEHSPTALLASRGFSFKRVLLGCGFYCPASDPTFLRAAIGHSSESLQASELHILNNINVVLQAFNQSQIKRISDLYCDVDLNALCTFPELDHFLESRGEKGDYYGTSTIPGYKSPVWPPGSAPRVFAYLRPTKAVHGLLEELGANLNPLLLTGQAANSAHPDRCNSGPIRLERTFLDFRQCAAQCDLAILNANHNTVGTMLLAGKPILQIPITLEHELCAKRTDNLGASLSCSADDPTQAAACLRAMLADITRFTWAAQRFASQYSGHDPDTQLLRLTNRIDLLLDQRSNRLSNPCRARNYVKPIEDSMNSDSSEANGFPSNGLSRTAVSPPAFFFVAGLPRSGSTLLMNLLGQHPQHHVTPTNALIELFVSLKDRWTEFVEFRSQGLEIIKPRVLSALRGLLHGFFAEEFLAGKRVFDKSRGWLQYIEPIEEVLGHPIQVIVTVRDVRAIVASFEKLYRRRNLMHRDAVGEDFFTCQSVDGRARALLSPKAAVGLAIARLRDVIERGVSDRLIIVPYSALTTMPLDTLALLHDSLGISRFVYDADHVAQITHEDDWVHGMDLHRVRPRVEPPGTIPWEGILSKETAAWIAEDYADIGRLSTWPPPVAPAAGSILGYRQVEAV